MKKPILALALVMIAAGAAHSAPRATKKVVPEKKEATWNIQEGEQIEALTKKGDRRRGEEAYEVCGACHLPSGAGRTDGTFPQLAGQHSTVLIKQMVNIRSGLRDNPTMYPFAAERSTNTQELADVSAYIESLCIPLDHGYYDSKRGDAAKDWKAPTDTAQQLAQGKDVYEKECVTCHGANGEGIKDKFYPVIAGQHATSTCCGR